MIKTQTRSSINIISCANTSPHLEIIDPVTRTPGTLLDGPYGRELMIIADTLYWARDGVQQLSSAMVHTQVDDGGYSWNDTRGLAYSAAEDAFYVGDMTGQILRLPRGGGEAVLIGDQGDDRVTVEELAERAGTIVHEIPTRLGPRLPRVYA